MISSRAPLFAAVALLSSSFSVGCSGPDAGFDSSYEMPTLTALTGGNGGTGGDNGLTSVIFHQYKDLLVDATSFRIADPSDEHLVSAQVLATGLLNTADGRVVFEYAVRCALPGGHKVAKLSPVVPFYGGGILTTTAGWLTGALTPPQRNDLFTCMLTHLNPEGAHVPIWLAGPKVTETAPTPPEYQVEEALWVALVDSSGIHFHVWPLPGVTTYCPSVSGDLNTRTCDTIPNCGLQVHSDLSTACTGAGDSWTCNGAPAIKTRLTLSSLKLLYSECCPPGQVCP